MAVLFRAIVSFPLVDLFLTLMILPIGDRGVDRKTRVAAVAASGRIWCHRPCSGWRNGFAFVKHILTKLPYRFGLESFKNRTRKSCLPPTFMDATMQRRSLAATRPSKRGPVSGIKMIIDETSENTVKRDDPHVITGQGIAVLHGMLLALVRRDGRDLTARQLAAFLSVYMDENTHTLSSLAELLDVSPPSVTRIMDRLVKFDLMTRRKDREDRRRVLVRRTTCGSAFFRELVSSSGTVAADVREVQIGVAKNLVSQRGSRTRSRTPGRPGAFVPDRV
jgi:DNA-binding MarR family transcriptional regulator